jgi:hypothetical protein
VNSRAKEELKLDDALVPLTQAVGVVYQAIGGMRPGNPDELDELRGLLAIALSTVAPVLSLREGVPLPLSARELQETLYVPVARTPGSLSSPPDLAVLYVRAGALARAAESLGRARIPFARAVSRE